MTKFERIGGITAIVTALLGVAWGLLCLGASVMSASPSTAHEIFVWALPLPMVALLIGGTVMTSATRAGHLKSSLPLTLPAIGLALLTLVFAIAGLVDR